MTACYAESAEIERASGVGETMLRGAGLSVLADRDEALAETVIVEPPSMSAEDVGNA